MSEVQQDAPQAPASAAQAHVPGGSDRAPAKRPEINWFRFWVQMAIAALVFNVLAVFVTWYFIFPRLHPAAQ